MNIIDKKIDDLTPYENNPRKNDGAVSKVAASIREFGFKVPIVIDRNNVIVCGHTRYKAAADLGMTSVPCIIADDLTDDQIKAFRLADNKVSEFAEWDFDKLVDELTDISDLDMSEFGFDVSEFSDDENPEIVEDDFDGEAEERTVVGDMYQLGDHFLICGDALDPNILDRLLNGNRADMVFTDPPYGYNYRSNMRVKSEKFDVLENDDTILDFFPNLIGRVKGFVMVCTTWKVLDKWIPLFKQCFDLSNMIIWDKGGGGIGDLKHTFTTDYEVILCANNGAEIKGKRIGSVWDIAKDGARSYEHPTQKPVELSSTAISHSSKKNDIVLDCFGGSGSTLIACEQLERRCYMIELDPHYCDVIISRWEKFTGKQAKKIG